MVAAFINRKPAFLLQDSAPANSGLPALADASAKALARRLRDKKNFVPRDDFLKRLEDFYGDVCASEKLSKSLQDSLVKGAGFDIHRQTFLKQRRRCFSSRISAVFVLTPDRPDLQQPHFYGDRP